MISRSNLGLRIAGLAVAAAFVVAAGQLLAISFDQNPLIASDAADRVERWIRSTPSVGAALLSGLALLAAAVAIVITVMRARGVDRPVVVVNRRRRHHGGVVVDRRTLADALERDLEKVDQRADVHVTVRRSGRIDLDLVSPDPTPTGSVLDIRERLETIVATRHLPCRSGKVRATRPRKIKGRRRVR